MHVCWTGRDANKLRAAYNNVSAAYIHPPSPSRSTQEALKRLRRRTSERVSGLANTNIINTIVGWGCWRWNEMRCEQTTWRLLRRQATLDRQLLTFSLDAFNMAATCFEHVTSCFIMCCPWLWWAKYNAAVPSDFEWGFYRIDCISYTVLNGNWRYY